MLDLSWDFLHRPHPIYRRVTCPPARHWKAVTSICPYIPQNCFWHFKDPRALMLFLLAFVMSNFCLFVCKSSFNCLWPDGAAQLQWTQPIAGTVGQTKYNMKWIRQREHQNSQAWSSCIIGHMFFLAALAPLILYSLCPSALLLHRAHLPSPSLVFFRLSKPWC